MNFFAMLTGDLRKAAQNADFEHERWRATSTDRAPEAARLRAEMLPRHRRHRGALQGREAGAQGGLQRTGGISSTYKLHC